MKNQLPSMNLNNTRTTQFLQLRFAYGNTQHSFPHKTSGTSETGEETHEESGGRGSGGLKEVEPSDPTENNTGTGGVLNVFREDQLRCSFSLL